MNTLTLKKLAAAAVLLLSTLVSSSYGIKVPQDNVHVDIEFELGAYTNRFEFFNEKIYAIYNSRSVDGVTSVVVEEYDLDGTLLSEFSIPRSSPIFVTVDANRKVYVYDDNLTAQNPTGLIQIYDWNGNLLHEFAEKGDAAGQLNPYRYSNVVKIQISPTSGRLYVTEGRNPSFNGTRDSLRVSVFEGDGSFLFTFSTAGILASTLETDARTVLFRPLGDGTEEIWVLEGQANDYFKIFDETGTFLRLFDATSYNGSYIDDAKIIEDQLFIYNNSGYLERSSSDLAEWTILGRQRVSPQLIFLGKSENGRLIAANNYSITVFSAPTLRTYDPLFRDAVPDPFVKLIAQRGGSTVLDIDFRVDDADDTTVSVAALGFADGTADLLNVIELDTLIEGTQAKLGAGIPTNTVHRISWDAASDWNVDFGDVNVVMLARDSRPYWFDVHLVEIPADGDRPAVTITRNPLDEDDFLAQWFWLIATNDASISLVDGSVYAAGGVLDGELLATGTQTTAIGRDFLLARDGLRVATEAEVQRAREGATPGYVAQLTPQQSILTGYGRQFTSGTSI